LLLWRKLRSETSSVGVSDEMFYGTVSSCLVVVTDFLGEVLSAIFLWLIIIAFLFAARRILILCVHLSTLVRCVRTAERIELVSQWNLYTQTGLQYILKGIWIPPKIRVLSHYPKLYRFSGIFHHNTSVVNRVRPSQFVDNIERPTLLTAMTVTDTVGHDDDRFTIVIKRHAYCILRKFSNDWECCALSLWQLSFLSVTDMILDAAVVVARERSG